VCVFSEKCQLWDQVHFLVFFCCIFVFFVFRFVLLPKCACRARRPGWALSVMAVVMWERSSCWGGLMWFLFKPGEQGYRAQRQERLQPPHATRSGAPFQNEWIVWGWTKVISYHQVWAWLAIFKRFQKPVGMAPTWHHEWECRPRSMPDRSAYQPTRWTVATGRLITCDVTWGHSNRFLKLLGMAHTWWDNRCSSKNNVRLNC